MNKFVFSALATTLVSATGFANDTEWPELDRELAALNNAPLSLDSHEGLHVSGWLIASITSDDTPADDTSDDLGTGGIGAAVNMSGSVGSNYSFALGWDFFDIGEQFVGNDFDTDDDGVDDVSGAGGVTDAYLSVGVADGLDLTFGIFRNHVLGSAAVERNQTFFIERSYLGQQYAARDAGVALNGSFNRIGWEVAVQNGSDGSADELAYSLHAGVDVMGSSSGNEGGLNAAAGTNLNIGLTMADDQGLDDGGTVAADLGLTSGAFSAWGEMADQDADVNPDGAEATPWSLGLAYLFGGNYEVGLRYDDHDDADGHTRYTLGLNRYIAGHDIKWQLNISSGDNDLDGVDDSETIALALAVSF